MVGNECELLDKIRILKKIMSISVKKIRRKRHEKCQFVTVSGSIFRWDGVNEGFVQEE